MLIRSLIDFKEKILKKGGFLSFPFPNSFHAALQIIETPTIGS